MKNNKNFNAFHEAQKVLGDDFWEVLSEVYPMVGPRIDVLHSVREMVIIMDVPGIHTQQDLSINVHNSYLIIKGEIPNSQHQGYEYSQQERFFGPFKRSIKLPPSAILDQLQAHYRYGLLHIIIPLSDQFPEQESSFPISFSNE